MLFKLWSIRQRHGKLNIIQFQLLRIWLVFVLPFSVFSYRIQRSKHLVFETFVVIVSNIQQKVVSHQGSWHSNVTATSDGIEIANADIQLINFLNNKSTIAGWNNLN